VLAGAQQVEHVVARHGRDRQAAQAERRGDGRDLVRRGDGIRSAHVGDDADAALRARRQHRAHALLEQRVVAAARVESPRLLREGDGALGEALEHEVVEVTVLGELERGLDAVSGVAGAGAEPDRSHGPQA